MAGIVAPIDRICIECGGPITLPDVTGAKRKYCSITCATRANNRPKHSWCPECGHHLDCRECGWTPD